VYSPAGAQAYGLARPRDLGVELVHGKGVHFDWARTLEAALAFEREHSELSEPPGFWTGAPAAVAVASFAAGEATGAAAQSGWRLSTRKRNRRSRAASAEPSTRSPAEADRARPGYSGTGFPASDRSQSRPRHALRFTP